MARITEITAETASPEVKPLIEAIQKKLGTVPNIFKNMGNSPAVLGAFLSLSDAAGKTSLSPSLREEIALVVGQTNHCNYCLAAHSTIGQSIGLSETDVINARKGHGKTPKEEAILQFAKSVVEKRGVVSATEVEALKKADVSDKELVEIILIISINIFTNYFNHITDPVIDFKVAPSIS